MEQLTQEKSKNILTQPDCIKTDVSLKEKNWFKTGGTARFFCQPATPLEFQTALHFARTKAGNLFCWVKVRMYSLAMEGFDGLDHFSVFKRNCTGIRKS